MSEGIRSAIAEFDAHSANNHKIMILLTDGVSLNNTISLSLAAEAYEKNIKIYTIGLGSSTNIDVGLLTQIATKTGGKYFHGVSAD